MTDNVPNLFEFFYHLVFENVTIQIVQADVSAPIRDGVTP